MTDTPNWSKKTILVVEDEEINRFFFKTALQFTNANLLFAENGREGIEMALQNNQVDCVLMDIRLPEVDGYQATKSIKDGRQNLPIIVQTAYALSNERLKAIQSGCDDFLAKPIKIETLYDVLKKYLG